jgi:hypothetical protein
MGAFFNMVMVVYVPGSDWLEARAGFSTCRRSRSPRCDKVLSSGALQKGWGSTEGYFGRVHCVSGATCAIAGGYRW